MQPNDPNPYQPPNSDYLKGKDSKDDLPSGEKLIVLSTYDNSTDAHMFRNELEQHGIVARVSNENTTAIFGATIAGPSSAFWIEVLVLESQANKALEIKNNWLNSNEAEAIEIPEWKCSCGETVDAGFAVCWNCQSEYQNPNA